MESSSPKPYSLIASMRSSVSSVPFVVIENRNGLLSRLILLTSGSMSPSHISIGSPPKKFTDGAVPFLSAPAARKSAALSAVSASMSSRRCFTKQ